ncbi:MAG TPA: DUF3943 domain-containing protein, partial [Vicinamibacteria bacterium]|nr:DUF3943 domain-containing protein [Vicinamibacteria bacterium]
RSAGLDFWTSLLYSFGGSLLWEIAGEATPPSLNDQINTSIGGAFLGEAAFRMASWLLEDGGESPGFWRELGAAVLSPPTGFNRLAFGDRFRAVFPSRRPAVLYRLRAGATYTAAVDDAAPSLRVRRAEGSLEAAVDYGLPGRPGYRYTRPFDYFHVDFRAVPNARSAADAIEALSVRGLLAGRPWAVGSDLRGVWGLFGNYDYLSPQPFRVSTTALSAGTVGQWWLAPGLALQGTALGGLGLGAAGTVGDRAERDYHYGVTPQTLLDLRLLWADRVMLEATGRQFYVAGTSSGTGIRTGGFGQEVILRGGLGLTVRLAGPHALELRYLASSRNAGSPDLRDRHQSVQAVTLSYTFVSDPHLGAVDWRPDR